MVGSKMRTRQKSPRAINELVMRYTTAKYAKRNPLHPGPLSAAHYIPAIYWFFFSSAPNVLPTSDRIGIWMLASVPSAK